MGEDLVRQGVGEAVQAGFAALANALPEEEDQQASHCVKVQGVYLASIHLHRECSGCCPFPLASTSTLYGGDLSSRG